MNECQHYAADLFDFSGHNSNPLRFILHSFQSGLVLHSAYPAVNASVGTLHVVESV